MTATTIQKMFESFTKAVGAEIRHSQDRQSVSYADLESQHLNPGYIRLCIDSHDHVVIIEAATPLSSVIPSDNDSLQKLWGLCLMANPCQSGKRFFPMIDMKNEHLILSYVLGSEAIRHEDDFGNIIESYVGQVAAMLKELKDVLIGGHAPGKTSHRLQAQARIFPKTQQRELSNISNNS